MLSLLLLLAIQIINTIWFINHGWWWFKTIEKKNSIVFYWSYYRFSFHNHSKSVMFCSQKRKNSAYFSIQFFKFNHLLFFIFQLWNFEKKNFHYSFTIQLFLSTHTHTQRIVYCQFDSRNRISFRIMTITHTHTVHSSECFCCCWN